MAFKNVKNLGNRSKNIGRNELKVIDSVIVDDDQVYKLSEYTEDEVAEFLEGLTSSAVDQIKTFFETMPRLRIEIPYKIDDKEKKFVVEGLESFFM